MLSRKVLPIYIAIIHTLVAVFPTSPPSYFTKYGKDRTMSLLPCHLSPLHVCNLKFFFWQWTTASSFWIPVSGYHSYHWPYSVWYYWLWAPIWKKKKILVFGPLINSTLIWILFLCFVFFFFSSSSCFLWGMARSSVGCLYIWHRVQQTSRASPICVSSFCNAPTFMWALIIFTWNIQCPWVSPPACSSRCIFLKYYLLIVPSSATASILYASPLSNGI